MSVYRRRYSTEHVHIRLLEEWRNKLDNNLLVGAVSMDFSKVFEFIRHDLIITKKAVYGMQNESLSIFLSYFTN